MTRAVAFDLDGTLAESKQRVSAEMGNLLGDLLRRMPVAVMSGAGFPQFQKQFFPAIPGDASFERLYIFPDNAAQCFVFTGDRWHPQYDYAFSKEEKEHIAKVVYQALDEAGMHEAPVRVWGERLEDRGAEEAFSILGQEAPVEEKRRWHDAHDADRQRLREGIARLLPEFAVATGGLTTIDITRKGITKAYGIERFAELSHIPLADMLYVGDALGAGGNDAVVLETGVQTHAVFGPEETAGLIRELLLHAPALA